MYLSLCIFVTFQEPKEEMDKHSSFDRLIYGMVYPTHSHSFRRLPGDTNAADEFLDSESSVSLV